MAVPKALLRPRRRRQCSSRHIWTPLTHSTSYARHLTRFAYLHYDVCSRHQSTTTSSSTALYGVAKTTRLCMIFHRRTLKAPCLDPSDGFPARSDLRRTSSASPLLSSGCKGYLFFDFLYLLKYWSRAPGGHRQNSRSRSWLGPSARRGHPRD